MRPLSPNNSRDRKVGMKRLLKLADFLEKVPNRAFDFGGWVGSCYLFRKNPDPHTCGTTACAFGWATAIKSFQDKRRANLKMTAWGPYNGKSYGTYAAQETFGLTNSEAYSLFIPCSIIPGHSTQGTLGSNATAKQVAKHIRTFAKKQLNLRSW